MSVLCPYLICRLLRGGNVTGRALVLPGVQTFSTYFVSPCKTAMFTIRASFERGIVIRRCDVRTRQAARVLSSWLNRVFAHPVALVQGPPRQWIVSADRTLSSSGKDSGNNVLDFVQGSVTSPLVNTHHTAGSLM